MIIIKSDSDLRRMRRAGEITGMTLKAAEAAIKPGMSTKELDGIIEVLFVHAAPCRRLKATAGFRAARVSR